MLSDLTLPHQSVARLFTLNSADPTMSDRFHATATSTGRYLRYAPPSAIATITSFCLRIVVEQYIVAHLGASRGVARCRHRKP
jgi:hypothetical protein